MRAYAFRKRSECEIIVILDCFLYSSSGTHQRVVEYALQNVELLDDALYICVCVVG
jgi:hypothetical protein